MAVELERVNRELAMQIASHLGWGATVSWNGTKVIVNYVGPTDKDPGHYIPGVGHPSQN